MAALVASIVVATAAGVVAERRWGARTRRATERLLDLLFYAVMPLISFVLVTRLELTVGTGIGLLFGVLASATAGAVGLLMGRLLGLPRTSIGALACTAVAANTGYLGLPLTRQLLGGDELGAAAAYDAIVSSIGLFVIGVAIGALYGTRAGASDMGIVRALLTRNPLLLAIALGLVVPDAVAPDAAVDVARTVVPLLFVAGFFILGVYLTHEREDGALEFPPRVTLPVATAVGLRLVVAPATLLLLSAALVSVPDAYKLQAAMPTGITTLLVAHIYGLDLRLVAAAVLWSTTVVVTVAVAVGTVI